MTDYVCARCGYDSKTIEIDKFRLDSESVNDQAKVTPLEDET